MNSCLTNYISLQCPRNEDFKSTINGVLTAFTATCNVSPLKENQVKSYANSLIPYYAVVILPLIIRNA